MSDELDSHGSVSDSFHRGLAMSSKFSAEAAYLLLEHRFYFCPPKTYHVAIIESETKTFVQHFNTTVAVFRQYVKKTSLMSMM